MYSHHLSFAFCLCILLAPLSVSATETDDAEPSSPAELRKHINSILQDNPTPGAGIAVVEHGEVTLADGFGTADRRDDRHASADTLFRLGSISKTFVGLTTLDLQERDLLNLSDQAKQLEPKLPLDNPHRDTQPVRLSHLLEHTAGLSDMGIGAAIASQPDIDLLDGLRASGGPWQARWPPGRYFAYSNPGPTMVAATIERVTGESFEQVSHDALFEPLDMQSAVWKPSDRHMQRMAVGYAADGETPYEYQHLLTPPSGALSLSPPDMATFLQLMVGRGAVDGNRILTDTSLRRAERPETTLAAKQGLVTGYGLGIANSAVDGHMVKGHDGGMPGFQASYRYVPGESGYMVSINASDAAAFQQLKSTLTDYILRDLEPPQPTDAIDLSGDDLRRFNGYYEPFGLRHDWTRMLVELQSVHTVNLEGDSLHIAPMLGGESTELIPTGPRTFRPPSSPKATVAFLESGDIQQNRGMGTLNLRPVSPLIAWARFSGFTASLLTIISALLFSLIWIPRWALGSISDRRLSARAATTAASWSLVVLVVVIATAMGPRWMHTLGTMNPWTIAIALTSGLFTTSALAAALWTLYLDYQLPDMPPNWGAWLAAWHTRLTALALLTLATYLTYYNLPVLLTWQL